MPNQYHILVVDDDTAIVNIIETSLQQAGYKVLTAGNGSDACRIAEKMHPHLIIMDVMMPQCNGILATIRIREQSNVPILMLSAKAEGSDRVIGLEAGADDYLVKPFYQQELLARVRASDPDGQFSCKGRNTDALQRETGTLQIISHNF